MSARSFQRDGRLVGLRGGGGGGGGESEPEAGIAAACAFADYAIMRPYN